MSANNGANSYSQWKGMLAITKASLLAIMRSPSAVIFSIFFPLIFILVFGFLGKSSGPVYKLVLVKDSDTANVVYTSLKSMSNIRFVKYEKEEELNGDLMKGRITGVLGITAKEQVDDTLLPPEYLINFKATTASADKFSTLLPLLENVINKIDKNSAAQKNSIATVSTDIEQVREYRTIDFILPGQLGFSLLSAGVFGVAFLFFNLRQQLGLFQ